ncbi:flagellar biosynthetic protein FliO [bacterium]|nr:flagellar biosynthetic protein FliO [bacterium]
MRGLRFLKSPLGLAASAFGLLGLLSLWPASATGAESPAAGLPLLRLALALTGILALALAALPALRRLQSAGGKGQRRLRCEEVLALDGRHRVALLRVDDRELLVSLQADGSRLLLDLGADGAAATAPAADFSSAMRRARA